MSSDRITEILNYVSAISHEVGAFRSETNTRFAEVNAHFERLETEMQTRFDKVEARLDYFETEIRALYGEMTGIRADIRDIRDEMHIRASRLDRLQIKVEENQDDLRDLKPRVASLESKT